jgi:hypothetical protein
MRKETIVPAKSAKQYKYFQAVAHGNAVGPSKEVAKEFIDKTSKAKRSLFMKKKKNASS